MYILSGLAVKEFVAPRVQYLKHYAHFNTPLNDEKTLKEAFSSYELTGEYFPDPNSIN